MTDIQWLSRLCAALYVAGGLSSAASMVEIDRLRCRQTMPLAYVFGGVLWPFQGAVILGLNMLGGSVSNYCAKTEQPK